MVAERTTLFRDDSGAKAGAKALRAVPAGKSPDSATERAIRAHCAVSPVCRNGHRRTLANTRLEGDGYVRCQDCVRCRRRPLVKVCSRHRRTPGAIRRNRRGRRYCVPCCLERAREMNRRRAAPVACRNGHAYTPDNVIATRDGRRCRICRALAQRAYRERQKTKSRLTASATPIAAHSASERPLTGFDAVVAAQVARARQIAATGRPTFRDVIRAGEAARRERRIRERGRVLGTPTPEQIRAATADAFCLDLADLTGPCREYDVARPRQLAYWLIRQECPGVSLEAIGRLFGRDHTTVMFGVEKVARLVAAGDEDVLRDLQDIRANL